MCSIKQSLTQAAPKYLGLIPHLSKFVLQTEMDTIVLLCELLIELLYSCMKKLLLYLMELLHTLVTNKTKMWRADFNLLIFMRWLIRIPVHFSQFTDIRYEKHSYLRPFLLGYFEPIWESKVSMTCNTVVEKSRRICQNFDETYFSIFFISFQ